jgi:hypothetical protein
MKWLAGLTGLLWMLARKAEPSVAANLVRAVERRFLFYF